MRLVSFLLCRQLGKSLLIHGVDCSICTHSALHPLDRPWLNPFVTLTSLETDDWQLRFNAFPISTQNQRVNAIFCWIYSTDRRELFVYFSMRFGLHFFVRKIIATSDCLRAWIQTQFRRILHLLFRLSSGVTGNILRCLRDERMCGFPFVIAKSIL